jgi:hypothetical protein
LKVVPCLLLLLVALAAPCGAAWGQPADQLAFVAANAVVLPPAGTKTPLKGVERKIAARDKAVCAAKRSPDIRDWVGVVKWNYDEGDVFRVSIAIGGNVDIGNLIRSKGSRRPIYGTRPIEDAETVEALSGLRKGDRVVFSGRLNSPNLFGGQCYGLNNIFIQDRHDKPEYHITFSRIATF